MKQVVLGSYIGAKNTKNDTTLPANFCKKIMNNERWNFVV